MSRPRESIRLQLLLLEAFSLSPYGLGAFEHLTGGNNSASSVVLLIAVCSYSVKNSRCSRFRASILWITSLR